MLIDTHCHLLHARYADEPAVTPTQLIEESIKNNVLQCIGIACERAEWQPYQALAAAHPAQVFLAVGIHPQSAGEGGQTTEEELLSLAQNPQVVAFGETGLDYHFEDNAPKPAQQTSFHTHLEVAQKAGLPAVIHTRDAEADTLAILAEHPHARFVLHSFTGSRALAEKAVEQGGYISFSGILTFKKSTELRQIASILPREKVLVETDAPYLAPEPVRGRRCTPAMVAHTAAVLAQVWQCSTAEAAQITSANARALFTRLAAA
ncbi:MAG: YchF/TatD family DNA exonuclease [Proteobacteria bacterium]|nr:YchF/TatD family DNA exonuclease [Pseudomonadota bacterium]